MAMLPNGYAWRGNFKYYVRREGLKVRSALSFRDYYRVRHHLTFAKERLLMVHLQTQSVGCPVMV